MQLISTRSSEPVPGRYGWRILGTLADTVDFFLISGWEQFFRRRQRRYASNVFKVNLFQPTIALLDDDAIEPLVASGDFIQGNSYGGAPLRQQRRDDLTAAAAVNGGGQIRKHIDPLKLTGARHGEQASDGEFTFGAPRAKRNLSPLEGVT
jgi:hypothetical protein